MVIDLSNPEVMQLLKERFSIITDKWKNMEESRRLIRISEARTEYERAMLIKNNTNDYNYETESSNSSLKVVRVPESDSTNMFDDVIYETETIMLFLLQDDVNEVMQEAVSDIKSLIIPQIKEYIVSMIGGAF